MTTLTHNGSAMLTVPSETLLTPALCDLIRLHTLRILWTLNTTTTPGVLAELSVAFKSWITSTGEASDCVDALGVVVAVVQSGETFIYIGTKYSTISNKFLITRIANASVTIVFHHTRAVWPTFRTALLARVRILKLLMIILDSLCD